MEFDNTPTDGFVLNKGVGGARNSYGWNPRNEYIRVYDPRDFEFEISVANLLFILRECDCSRGKGLEGKFVYAWDKNNLVLLPVVSQDYKLSTDFTNLQDKSIKAKDLIPGATYLTRKQETLIYIGRFMKYTQFNQCYDNYVSFYNSAQGKIKQYVFWSGKDFVFFNEPRAIAVRQGDVIAPNFAELVDKYNKSFYSSKAVELFTKEIKIIKPNDHYNWVIKEGNEYLMYETHCRNNKIEYIRFITCVCIDDEGNLIFYNKNNFSTGYLYPPDSMNYNKYNRYNRKWIEPTNNRLWVRLESGEEYEVGLYKLMFNFNKQNEENKND